MPSYKSFAPLKKRVTFAPFQYITSMSRQRYISLILILGSLTALGPFSIDMYLPGFPAIAKDLNTTVASISLSLSSYFIGISAGQLLYGPLLDRFGRKKPLYIGLGVYILASLGCAWATTLDALIWLRFIQAIGSCAATVASVAMVRDLFPVKDSPKVFALLMLVVGLSPMLAPTVGGYVTAYFGWHTVFIVLAVMGFLFLLASKFGLPDTHKPDPSISLKPKPIIRNFIMVLREPQFYTYAFTGAVAFSGLFTYVAASPMIFMDIYNVDEKVYGWIFAFLSIGMIGGSQLNSLLLKKYKSEQIIFATLVSQVVITIVFLICSWYNLLGLYGTIALIFFFLLCIGLANPNNAGLSLAPFARNAGSASALMGAAQLGMGAIASFVVGIFTAKSVIPMVMIMAVSSIIALLILTLGRRNIKNTIDISIDSETVLH